MLSNYTIKQALPRLIIAAIAINLSYWVCALAVDMSNLLGASVFKLLQQVGLQTLDATSLDTIIGLILAGGATTAVAVGAGTLVAKLGVVGLISGVLATGAGTQILVGLVLMAVSVVLGIALAIFLALLILAARQALVIILIVVSPIAFALYILPGTKSIFEKWRKLFTTMLVFYPLFSLLYGGCLIAASILISSSGDSNSPVLLRMVLLFMGMAAQFIPLVFTPWLFIKGTGELGELGRKVMQKGRSLTSMPGNFGRKYAQEGVGLAGHELKRRFKQYAAGAPDTRRGRLARRLAFSDVRREAAKHNAEAGSKELNAAYRHSELHGMHADTMEKEENIAGIEATEKAEALTQSPTLQSAVATRKAAELGASMERANIESNAETVHAETNATLYARNKQSSLSTNLARAEAENPAETAHIQANARRYAGVKQSSLSASMERSIAENQGELQHLEDERTDLYVRQAESQGQLEHAKASQDRLISDLKTEEGIRKHAGTGPNQVDVQVADNIRTAALGKRVQSMAQQNAELQHSAESAQQILADPTIASEAGGVATHGATMAQAQAKRAVADDFNKTVAAMKTLHSQTDSSVLREKFDTIDKLEKLSTEEVASDAGLIASRNHVEEQIKLQAQLQKLGQQIQLMPNSSRKTTLQDKLKTIVQQVSDDRKIKVAGLSTKELGANQVGEVAADGKNIFEASRDRILSHMTVERMATTPFGDPDQLAMYYEMARANKLSTDELNKIGETYASWKVSKQHRDSLSDNQRQLFDAILTRTPPPGYKTKYADGIATLT